MAGLTIGKLAAAAGIGVETVRFYQREGLIERPARPASGFRVYSRDAIEQLAFVREAQEVGFTLKEIRALLALRANQGADCAAVRGRATVKLAQLEARMAKLARMRSALRRLLAACPGRGELENCSIVGALSVRSKRAAPRAGGRSARRKAMKWAELSIEGMHCEGCAKTIEALLAAEPGVKAATASYSDASARVLFDPANVQMGALVAAVERAGYRARESR